MMEFVYGLATTNGALLTSRRNCRSGPWSTISRQATAARGRQRPNERNGLRQIAQFNVVDYQHDTPIFRHCASSQQGYLPACGQTSAA
jgi:hypothetical protein